MIKSRSEILSLNEVFSEHLVRIQKLKYGSSDEWLEGESVILDSPGEATVLTKEQADELNHEDQQYYLFKRDVFPIENDYKLIGSTVLVSSKTHPQEYLQDMSQGLADLSGQFGRLIILGDWNTPWLSQENDRYRVAQTLTFLREKIDDTFEGGFLLKGPEITEFIPHLFWLIRCNASLPDFLMSFEYSKTIFTICKYGSLHLEFYDIHEKEMILQFYHSRNYQEVSECNDPLDFHTLDKPPPRK